MSNDYDDFGRWLVLAAVVLVAIAVIFLAGVGLAAMFQGV